MPECEGKAFQAACVAGAKVLRQEPCLCVARHGRRGVDRVRQPGVRSGRKGGPQGVGGLCRPHV